MAEKRHGGHVLNEFVQQQVLVADIKTLDKLAPSLQTHRETDQMLDPVGKISCGIIGQTAIDHFLTAKLRIEPDGFRRLEPSVWHE